MAKPKITVIGSMNIDMVTETDVMPNQGETIFGSVFSSFTGGKGANQAVACARLGAQVRMIGCVGNDHFGKQLLEALQKEGVNTDDVKTVTHQSTGIATITVCDNDNRIIVIPGANYSLLPEDISALKEMIADSDMLLLQQEIPFATVEAAIKLANELDIPVILNPAPAIKLPQELLEQVYIITPNEYELSILLGLGDNSDRSFQRLMDLYPHRIVMTGGSNGAFYKSLDGEIKHEPGRKVQAVDTTGAGDTFNGALAVKLSEGSPLDEAVKFAVAASALSVTKLGAQSGMPLRIDVERFIETQN
ncbi:ribokinase [Paenibacillus sp. NEAU-GSW1]|uniref:ribokinase n=1 Tax=Paenibacillus sp. NEAU-GSW1 TaxID=2682486 RepID=UPI0012E19577|nr:ribokinase [Paenibacillus sp. NEAU-GSW1]MUT67306.1 ribokinase [Paenibacillus sp. NEAU-GSW1]